MGRMADAEERRRARIWAEENEMLERQADPFRDLLEGLLNVQRLDLERWLPAVREGGGLLLEEGRQALESNLVLQAAGQGSYLARLEITLRSLMNQSKGKWEAEIAATADKIARALAEHVAEAKIGFDFPGFPGEVESWLTGYSPPLVDRINDLTLVRIRDAVTNGFSRGDSLEEIEDEIRRIYSGWVRSRPATIARTETGFVAARTEDAVIRSAGIPQTQLEKIWLTARDLRVRGNKPRDQADHVRLDGERRLYNQRFSNGLKFPREPGGPAKEVINCRCVQMYKKLGGLS